MLRNRSAAPILQKTYDESYLTCSTAVYYESQGNEDEAMRCWKLALDQIYDHHSNKAFPNYTPRSETEKALIESLRQLELQCKERIDLLEALRLSRQETSRGQLSSGGTPGKSSGIGSGTIPAVTYAELSRPVLPNRPSMPTRTSSEKGFLSEDYAAYAVNTESPSPALIASQPIMPPPTEGRSSRPPSPERHTMRTTLRTTRLGDKSLKLTSRRPVPKPADGPGANKAAALAWSTLGRRGKADEGLASAQTVSQPLSNPETPSDRSRQSFELPERQWDTYSRRLVPPKAWSPGKPSDERSSPTQSPIRHSDEYSYPRPSPLSISAASNAISSMAIRENAGRPMSERGRAVEQENASSERSRTGSPRKVPDTKAEHSRNVGERLSGSKHASESSFSLRHPTVPGSPAFSASINKLVRNRQTRKLETQSTGARHRRSQTGQRLSSSSGDDSLSESRTGPEQHMRRVLHREDSLIANPQIQSPIDYTEDEDSKFASSWKKKKSAILKKLPLGVDEHAAKQILNEIVVRGDEVHWSDVAGLDMAKNALRENVVYPFLRPDLFMGLREPARGMLLFGPPGTGKTMLARAVATESKSTFFSISASSLTSKYLGESEKLVRALFSLAKVLAPSIIFVDEIDSLLSQRSGSGEHEATRRIKTEFLIQWSDLQRAAVGREAVDRDKDRDDASRVLVLAATNLPWAIDEAARRRFVRRQYIPLPESKTRAVQLKTLLEQQNHTLTDADIEVLVGITDGFSGSDITALAKDAAMGPLRSLGEALLHMTMDEIRPIELSDFVASLVTIRPSVSKTGLQEYEDWAKEFGERGG
ncbi:P-loop containing nucleoside triphosphate hydrolase protein [Lasiosphaeria ovina]|uniref:P-loop containing nucleoside triphosphate hydrolase protein n=1 Tax=Lasiosphaeria ovina TaxID=92902 RepID=A0AAE0KGC2_9PEZI|nr:P-loop containing nucleoside triphosphate hydrolase protein [Lasiosphaeria ovina]